LVHVIYSGVSRQCSHTLHKRNTYRQWTISNTDKAEKLQNHLYKFVVFKVYCSCIPTMQKVLSCVPASHSGPPDWEVPASNQSHQSLSTSTERITVNYQ